jgi:hypothetical protein
VNFVYLDAVKPVVSMRLMDCFPGYFGSNRGCFYVSYCCSGCRVVLCSVASLSETLMTLVRFSRGFINLVTELVLLFVELLLVFYVSGGNSSNFFLSSVCIVLC